MSNFRAEDLITAMYAAPSDVILTPLTSDVLDVLEVSKKVNTNKDTLMNAPEVNNSATSPTSPIASPISSSSATSAPSAPVVIPTMDEIKHRMANLNIGTILDKMVADPEQTKKLMTESAGNMTPDMMEKAKKLAQSGQADHIIKEMQKRGMSPHAMRADMEQQRKTMRALEVKNTGPTKKVLVITLNRQLKSRSIPVDATLTNIASIIHCPTPVEISCSRLAFGPWANKTIKVWYDAALKGKNKRSSKVVGFPVAGDILIHCENGDLTEEEFVLIEQQLE